MSGVYIKGFTIPTECDVGCPMLPSIPCPIRSWKDLMAVEDGKRHQDCPLIPVPPHGRLIDADAFEKANAYFWGMDFINAKYEDCLCDLVNAAPTIIPADKDGAE